MLSPLSLLARITAPRSEHWPGTWMSAQSGEATSSIVSGVIVMGFGLGWVAWASRGMASGAIAAASGMKPRATRAIPRLSIGFLLFNRRLDPAAPAGGDCHPGDDQDPDGEQVGGNHQARRLAATPVPDGGSPGVGEATGGTNS